MNDFRDALPVHYFDCHGYLNSEGWCDCTATADAESLLAQVEELRAEVERLRTEDGCSQCAPIRLPNGDR